MTNSHKGFIVPLLVSFIALLLIGCGAYVYTQQKTDVQISDGKIDCLAMNLPPDCNPGAKEVSRGTHDTITGINKTQRTIAPSGAPAAPGIFEVSQPNGTKISINTKGDEHFNWSETVGGYSIAKATDGFWYYVSSGTASSGPIPEDNRNGFIMTNIQAHLPPPANLLTHIRPPTMLVGN